MNILIISINFYFKIPKSAYINALDFKSPKNLAEYLQYLDSNRTAYNSYFKWKKHISFHNQNLGFNTICSMCIQLQLEKFIGIKNNVIHNIDEHWNKLNNCKSPRIKTDEYFYFE